MRSATGLRCTRCGSSPGTATSAPPTVYFIRKEEDAEVAAREIQIRVTKLKGE
jgi:hypothetical protein